MLANSPLVLALSLVASILPTLLYIWLVWRIDRHEKEPVRLLLAAFVWGAAPAVALSIVFELLFEMPLAALSVSYHDVISLSLITPPIEEAFKALALLTMFWLAPREFDGVLDGVIYGSIVGLGFAMTENVFYFVGAWGDGGLSNWALVVGMRAVAFGLNHAMYTAFTGAAFGLACSLSGSGKRVLVILLGLGAATLAHAVHNGLLALGNLCFASLLADWGGVLVIFIVILLAWRRERAWLQLHLEPEVAAGLLTPSQFEIIVSRRRRLRHQLELLGVVSVEQTRLWRQLLETATELAFKKQQASHGADAKLEALIVTLRARMAALQAALHTCGA